MPIGAQFSFVRQAATAVGGAAISFAQNDAGDALVAVFGSVNTTGDASNLPVTIQDAEGNVWKLLYGSLNVKGTVSAQYVNMAVYVCPRCAPSIGNVLSMPPAMVPADNLLTVSYSAEFTSNYADLLYAQAAVAVDEIANFTLDGGDIMNQNLVVALVLDSGLTSNPQIVAAPDFPIPLSNTNNSYAGSAYEVSIQSAPLSSLIHVGINGATDAFGVLLVMVGTNAGGGSASQTLTFNLNKGPLPVTPPEGRTIATVIIDCTQQPVKTLPIQYPELEMYGNPTAGEIGPAGFVVCEFDLEHLFQGSGLSEVRAISAWCRPAFWYNDSTGTRSDDIPPSPGYFFPALLTNKTTGQTILLGSAAVNASTDVTVFGSYLVMPFPANKNSLKYRFIQPLYSLVPYGKYVIQFYNFELPAALESTQGLLSSTLD